jgi:Na+/H+-dicarboxylate symporter
MSVAGSPSARMSPVARKPLWRRSTFWIFVGLAMGVVLGGFLPQNHYPQAYAFFKFLSSAFIQLIKGLIVPLLFSTIVVGVAQTGDLKAVGRMGGKALLYFEIVTTLALFIGLFVVNWLRPGDGLPIETGEAVELAKQKTGWEIALHLFPFNLVEHAAKGDILPVVVFATLFGISLTRVRPQHRKPVLEFFEAVSQVMFKYTDIVMRLTPLGVFGAMAYNVSHMAAGKEIDGIWREGWPAVGYLLGKYATLVGSLYLALVLLVGLVFVPIMVITGVHIVRFFKAIREPAVTAFSTASSEAALPRLLEDIVAFGVPRRVASFVIPTGYSFNLDGSTLYLVVASVTIAQAAGVEMTMGEQVAMLLTFMLTSKGVAGVPRATLVIIAGTCASFGLPGEAGVAMLLAVDEIMDMARTMVNVIGNGLAAVVIATWEKVFGQADEGVGEVEDPPPEVVG